MKELSIEEKAKRYGEALEKAKMVLQERGNEPDGASVLSDLFPELAESEDERIRKALIDHIRHSEHNIPADKFNTWIAWLEKQGKENPLKGTLGDVFDDLKLGIDLSPKQGEQKPNKCMYSNDNYTDEDRKVLCDGCEEDCKLKQKPVEWSEEDEKMLNLIITRLHSHPNVELEEYEKAYNWLESLKDRVQTQPKQEWSEEDEKFLGYAIKAVHNMYVGKDKSSTTDIYIKTANWLKSLRPQKK